MTTFGLLHGAYYDSWCWESLTQMLRQAGHEVIVIDLPLDDVAVGLVDHADYVSEALRGTDNVTLVAHAASGLFLPLAAKWSNAGAMVFVTAIVPVEGSSAAEQMASHPGAGSAAVDRDYDDVGRWLLSPELATDLLFHDCPPHVQEQAVQRLRPQAPQMIQDVLPVGSWPAIPAASIIAIEDRVLSVDWMRQACRDSLGKPPLEIAGGHSPMLSRPSDLAHLLILIAGQPGS